jgi:hypothetical protein
MIPLKGVEPSGGIADAVVGAITMKGPKVLGEIA